MPSRVAIPLAALLTCWASVPAGADADAKAPPKKAAPPATRPPATQPKGTDKGRWPLAQIPPRVGKPVNPEGVDKLSPRTKDAAEEGEKLLASGDYGAALRQLERAVGFEPGNPRICRALAMAHLGLANEGKALPFLRRALAKAPDDLEGQLLLGKLALKQNLSSVAMTALRTAVQCTGAQSGNSLAAEALLLLGDQLKDDGYWQAALECYTQLGEQIDRFGRRYMLRAKLKPLVLRPERLMVRRGEMLLKLGQAGEAAELLDTAYRRDQTDPVKARLAVKAFLAAKKYPRAEKLLVELASQPTLKDVFSELVVSLCKASGDKGMPARLWRVHSKKRPNDVAMATALADIAGKLGAAKDAVEILKTAPRVLEVVEVLAGLQAQDGKTDQALRTWAQFAQTNPTANEGVRYGLVVLASRIKDRQYHKKFAQSVAGDKKASVHYVAGLLAEVRGDAKLAEAQLRKAIKLDAKFVPAYEALVEVLADRRAVKPLEALAAVVDKALPESLLALYARGRLMLLTGEAPDALSQLRKAANLDSKHLPTWMALAKAHHALGQFSEEETALLQAVALAPRRRALREKLFEHRVDVGELDSADEVIRTLSKQGAEEALIRKLQVRLFDEYLTRDRFDPAARRLANWKSAGAPPEFVGGLEVELLLAKKDAPGAKEKLAELAKAGYKSSDLGVLALRAELEMWRGPLARKDYDKALRRVAKLSGEAPASALAQRAWSMLLTSCGEPGSKANLADWDRLYGKARSNADVARQYAAALMRGEMYAPALTVLEDLLKRDADDEWSRRRLAEVLAKRKRYDQAEAKLKAWIENSPSRTTALWYRLRLLGVYEDAKRYDQAQKLLDEWIASTASPDLKVELANSKIRLFCLAKHFDQARAYTEKLASEQHGEEADRLQVRIRYRLALVLMEADKLDQTVALLDKWIPTTPDSLADQYRRLKLYALAKAKKLDALQAAAESWSKKAEKAAAADSSSLLLQFQVLVIREALVQALVAEAKQNDMAIGLLRGWIKALADPKKQTTLGAVEMVRWGRETLPRLLLAEDKFAEAAKEIEQALDSMPKSPDGLDATAADYERGRRKSHHAELMNLRATVLAELGKHAEARTSLEKALILVPDSVGFNNNLGYLYADRGIELERAEKMIRRALTDRPTELAYMDSLGWVLYKQGKVREAAAQFDLIIRRGKDEEQEHPVMCDHAGDVFYRLGWTQRAVGLWKQAVEMAKKEPRRSEELELIRKGTPAKIAAAEKGQPVKIAPLGKPPSDGGE